MAHGPGDDKTDPYEAVRYPGFPFSQTHPDRLFLIGVLHGLSPARPEACRILEIGCGDGLNLAAIAAGLPGVSAVGIDRAAAPLERGRRYAGALGLDLDLRALDLLDSAEVELGTFDYVVAHGVYAWVPEPVREALLALAARALAPDGVAYVSYNALPGGHVRRVMRDLFRFHARDAQSPMEAAGRAREITAITQRWSERTDPYGLALLHELKRMERLSDHSLVHDDLGEVWEPVSLSAFAAHAQEHGLRYFADAEPDELRYKRYPDGLREAMHELAPDDLVAREQYGDLISGRAFRQSLLCHPDRSPWPAPRPEALEHVLITSRLRPDPLADGGYASTLDAACAHLWAIHPRGMTLDELATASGIAAGELAPALLSGFRHDVVDLRTRQPRFTPRVPRRPRTWPLARLMAVEGTAIATLEHEVYRTDDPFRMRVIALMDGTRDRDALLDGVLEAVGSEILVQVEGEPIKDVEMLREPFGERLDEILVELAEAELMLADGS